MVRVNLINPRRLADQHLIAEYNEILMLLGHLKKHGIKSKIPESYVLGKGHINFFKNKLKYLEKRHEKIKKEMRKRDFKTNINIDINEFNDKLHNDWIPKEKDFKIIKERLIHKIKLKPRYYRYFGEYKNKSFFMDLINKN